MSKWPSDVAQFEAFLAQQGLVRTKREESGGFDNKVVEYADGRLAVRVVCEKSVWFVEVSDTDGQPGEWYDAAIVRDLLGGSGPDVLSLQDQIAIVRDNWRTIARRFGPSDRAESHARVDRLRKQRVRRLFPGLRGTDRSP